MALLKGSNSNNTTWCIWSVLLLVLFVHWAITAPIAATIKSSEHPSAIEAYENYFNEIDVESENADLDNRNAVQSPLQHWPERTIPYQISTDYTEEEANNVREAVRVFGEQTCITFEEYDAGKHKGKRYVRYMKSPDMCGTRVGFNPVAPPGSPHDVLLNPYCLTEHAVIQHESLHVLGLYHEQSRHDRNKYIQVQYENIPQKYWSQFMVYPNIYTNTFNVPYDYESLMHYSQYAFAKDPKKPTMLARNRNGDGNGNDNTLVERQMGQLKGPSEGDLTKIRLMYRC